MRLGFYCLTAVNINTLKNHNRNYSRVASQHGTLPAHRKLSPKLKLNMTNNREQSNYFSSLKFHLTSASRAVVECGQSGGKLATSRIWFLTRIAQRLISCEWKVFVEIFQFINHCMFSFRGVQVSSSRSVTSVVLVERLALSAANGDWARVRKKNCILDANSGFYSFFFFNLFCYSACTASLFSWRPRRKTLHDRLCGAEKTTQQLFTAPAFSNKSVHAQKNEICKFSVALIQPSNKFPLHLQLQSESNIYRTFETLESFLVAFCLTTWFIQQMRLIDCTKSKDCAAWEKRIENQLTFANQPHVSPIAIFRRDSSSQHPIISATK